VDGQMCFVEVIDTAGQGKQLLLLLSFSTWAFIEEYATLRDQWVRSVNLFFKLRSFFF
jgi:hypothetical protein